MQSLLELAWGDTGRVPLVVGAVLLYLAARMMNGSRGSIVRPGLMSLVYWIPIALAAILATLRGRSGLGLSILLGTSIASLSLVQGSVLLIAPKSEAPLHFRRLWPFVMPAALLALMAGFAGVVTRFHALVFLAEGVALLFVWSMPDTEPDPDVETTEKSATRCWLLVVSIVIASIGGLFALGGAFQISQPFPSPAADVVVPALLGPLLIIPLWMGETSQAYQQQSAGATTSAVGLVLLNLCLLLPAIVLLWFWRHHEPMVYSWLSWRVDTVALLAFGFILLPPSLGRWRLGTAEGITLIGLYVVYLLAGIVVATRV